MASKLIACRSCKSTTIRSQFGLGRQAYSGIFKTSPLDSEVSGELELVSCDNCGLVQLGHCFSIAPFFTSDYGYASGATTHMRNHLGGIVDSIKNYCDLSSGDVVLDIGCNDGTLLSHYSPGFFKRVGFDPVAIRYRENYPDDVCLETSFFSSERYFQIISERAKVVTSISMFYDLEDPLAFARDVEAVLDPDGVWIFEQSYLLSMLRTNSYDTMCHEHLEFYSIRAVENILRNCGMKILDMSLNRLNGGSIRIVASKQAFKGSGDSNINIELLRASEDFFLRDMDSVFSRFKAEIDFQADQLKGLLRKLRDSGKSVVGYGASTKGNVILQYCGVGPDLIPVIGDITPHKDGRYTPGTNIPIEDMNKVKARMPDYYLVLPWSFREDILKREQAELARGAKFIFPLPLVEVVG